MAFAPEMTGKRNTNEGRPADRPYTLSCTRTTHRSSQLGDKKMEKYSLVDDALFTCTDTTGRHFSASLPEILAGLCKAEISSFDALQLHQKQAWHCFLVQLGAIALTRSKDNITLPDAEPPSDADTWRRMLLSLTNGETAPWCMVVDNPAKPAFMQPPVPEGSLEDAKFSSLIKYPDELDILFNSKNHDIKVKRIKNPLPEHWVYTLITLQNLGFYSAAGSKARYYHITRVNSNYGNRSQTGLFADLNIGKQIKQDIQSLIQNRDIMIKTYQYDPQGIKLSWVLPWSGSEEESVLWKEFDPYFIEICHRIRVQCVDTDIIAYKKGTKAPRIFVPDDLQGKIGDPWLPINKKNQKVFSLGGNGWNYKIVNEILISKDYDSPLSMNYERINNGGYFVSKGVVRGQGKTQGYHQRILPIPSKIIKIFRSSPTLQEKLENRAKNYVEYSDIVQKILSKTLKIFFHSGMEKQQQNDNIKKKTGHLIKSYSNSVDQVFFQQLWDDVTLPEDQAYKNWQQTLYNIAGKLKEQAIKSYPVPSIRRYKAISRADAVFEGSARKVLDRLFPENFNHKEETQHELAGK